MKNVFLTMSFSGLVFNQSFEDNEMMKKLLLCSENSPGDNVANDNDVNGDEDDSDQDVIVETQSSNKDFLPLKTLYCDNIESLNHKNFNYDVIVHFVRQGKFVFAISLR